jgi:hypothetical protein
MLSSMGIAIAIHIVIALAVGSYVVFEGIVPAPFFESDFVDTSEPVSMIDEIPAVIEEQPLPQVESTAVETVQEAGGSDAPDMSDLITVTSATTSPSFSMPTTAGNPNLIGTLSGGSGTGSGSGVGSGKFVGSLFGSRTAIDNALVGRLYDLKQDRKGKKASMNTGTYLDLLGQFATSWDSGLLKDYYQADAELYARQFFIPLVEASEAPKAFDAENEITPIYWAAHYKGEVVAPVTGRMRFGGQGDNVLVVRFDNKVVLEASLGNPLAALKDVRRDVIGKTCDPGRRPMVAGEWFTVRRGNRYPMEVLLGEHGGLFSCYLMVEIDGENYKKQSDGKNPRLPIFQAGPAPVPEYTEGVDSPEVAKEPLVFGG